MCPVGRLTLLLRGGGKWQGGARKPTKKPQKAELGMFSAVPSTHESRGHRERKGGGERLRNVTLLSGSQTAVCISITCWAFHIDFWAQYLKYSRSGWGTEFVFFYNIFY